MVFFPAIWQLLYNVLISLKLFSRITLAACIRNEQWLVMITTLTRERTGGGGVNANRPFP